MSTTAILSTPSALTRERIAATRLSHDVQAAQRSLVAVKRALGTGDAVRVQRELALAAIGVRDLIGLGGVARDAEAAFSRARVQVEAVAQAVRARDTVGAVRALTAAAGALERGLQAALAKQQQHGPER